MNIELKQLRISNFKGIRSLDVQLSHRTNIFAANGLGKTTIFDAWLWLLFGKDSTDRDDTNFEIKTRENGLVIDKIEHEVEAVISANGQTIVLKRTLREKWVKKRGTAKEEFSGNETVYEWNSVPIKAGEYKARISELVDENIFKLITNTSYFNSMKWQDRRNILITMAGDITTEDIVEGDASLMQLESELSKYRDMEDFKKQISAAKKKLKDELDYIPSRIDEVKRSIQHLPADFSLLESELEKKKAELNFVEGGLLDEMEAQKDINKQRAAKLREIGEIEAQIIARENTIKQQFAAAGQEVNNEIAKLRDALRSNKSILEGMTADIELKTRRRDAWVKQQGELRAEWAKVDASKYERSELNFDGLQTCCPTCKRDYDTSDIEQKRLEMANNHKEAEDKLEAVFNSKKSRRLSEIQEDGKTLGQSITSLNAEIENIIANRFDRATGTNALSEKIAKMSDGLEMAQKKDESNINAAIITDEAIQALRSKMDVLKVESLAPINVTSTDELKSRKEQLTASISELTKQVSGKEQIKVAENRIAELTDSESKKSQELANLEQKEFNIDRYLKLKMGMVEERVNSKFRYVSFRMFDTTNDGAEFPACITLVNGVPYPDANNAARINAGLDIIHTLSEFYGVSAPVFVDNAESVTDLIEMDAQVIRLVVSKPDKKIRIESDELAMAN